MDAQNCQLHEERLMEIMSAPKLFVHSAPTRAKHYDVDMVLVDLLHEGLVKTHSSGMDEFYVITSPGKKVVEKGGYKRHINAPAERERVNLETKKLTLTDLQHTVKTNSMTFYLFAVGALLGF